MEDSRLMYSMLLDFYGELLTDKQRECFDLHYNEDLSLAEIAENYGITRQGVRDVIVRAEAILTDLEDKTGLIRRFHAMRTQLNEIIKNADGILACNNKYDDAQIELLAQQIRSTADTLSRE